jgi:hypothetical protein
MENKKASPLDIFQKTVKNTNEPSMQQLKHIAQIESKKSVTQLVQHKREKIYEFSTKGSVPKQWEQFYNELEDQ